MKKICPKCQAKNDEDAKYCTSCRQKFSEAAGLGKLCPAGLHTMDPNWTDCPYCRKSQPPARVETPGEEKKSMRDKTNYGEDRSRRVTKVEAGGTASAGKIVGIMLSYSRNPSGEVFPIREGKTYFGRDADACEFSFPDDKRMSDKHALIRYLEGRYQIFDQVSTNGTRVNGKLVDEMDLPNYGRILLGSMLFTFIKAEEQTSAGEERPERRVEREERAERQVEEVREPPPRKRDPTLF